MADLLTEEFTKFSLLSQDELKSMSDKFILYKYFDAKVKYPQLPKTRHANIAGVGVTKLNQLLKQYDMGVFVRKRQTVDPEKQQQAIQKRKETIAKQSSSKQVKNKKGGNQISDDELRQAFSIGNGTN